MIKAVLLGLLLYSDCCTGLALNETLCAQGTLSADGSICCPIECSTCGSIGCSDRKEIEKECCYTQLSLKNKTCEKTEPPCLLKSYSTLRFANTYGNHMVLQQAPQRAIIWGFCNEASCNKTKLVVDNNATFIPMVNFETKTWLVKLPAYKGGPTSHNITVDDGSNSITLSDVLFGDVWLCSGQSNSECLINQFLSF